MSYSLLAVCYEWNRYLPAVLAVTFCVVLIAMQCGLLLGIFSEVGVPIDGSRADVWVGHPQVPSVDLCLPIPERWQARLARQPEVERVETYVRGFILWEHPGADIQVCAVIGTALDAEALGPVQHLTPELRRLLVEPGAIVVDESELKHLGLRGIGDVAEVNGRRVRLVGSIKRLRGLAGAYIFCSLSTARDLLHLPKDRATYLLARCRNPADAPRVVERLRAYPNMSAFTKEELSRRSRFHWLTKTRVGVALGFAALLGLLVGGAVTSQTLYAATAASLHQYAILEALGIPTWRMAAAVLTQAFLVGVLGIGLGLPAIGGLAQLVQHLEAKFFLPGWLLASAVMVTMVMALLSGLLALRSLRLADPTAALRRGE